MRGVAVSSPVVLRSLSIESLTNYDPGCVAKRTGEAVDDTDGIPSVHWSVPRALWIVRSFALLLMIANSVQRPAVSPVALVCYFLSFWLPDEFRLLIRSVLDSFLNGTRGFGGAGCRILAEKYVHCFCSVTTLLSFH